MFKMIHNALKRLACAFAIGALLTSCGETNNKLQGYEWLEGEWSGAAVQQIFVNITPQYYQIAGEMWDDEMDIAKADKKDFSIKIIHDTTLGDLKGICDGEDSATIYIDESKQSIFWIYDFDKKIYLSKSDR